MRPNPDKLQVIEYEDYYNHSSTRRNKEKLKKGMIRNQRNLIIMKLKISKKRK
jgi:hypothetical protein